LYALYGGTGSTAFVAYVGLTVRLRTRIEQHLQRNSSSVTAKDSAVILNTRQITEVRWWTIREFNDGAVLAAAEQIAFEILQPVLRSQGKSQSKSRELVQSIDFRKRIADLLVSSPSGTLVIPTLQDALDKISRLEQRIAVLESSRSNGPN
jgi:hypothetical protein